MKKATMGDLQESLADKSGFKQLADYKKFCLAYLALVETERHTRIVSPSHEHYVFYQYGKANRNKITRPLNTQLFFESSDDLTDAFDRFIQFLGDLKKHRQAVEDSKGRSNIWSPTKSIAWFIRFSNRLVALEIRSKTRINRGSASARFLNHW